MIKRIYLDNAATTPMDLSVIKTINENFNNFGNPSSTHWYGRNAFKILRNARHILAESICASDKEIIFTSGATESNNTSIISVAFSRHKYGNHIITTSIEHPSVLNTMKYLESLGFEITYLPVNEYGCISLKDFKDALRDDTILVSIMYGNNEVGTLMPITQIGEILKNHQAVFHSDATQALGIMDIDVKKLHLDLLSASAHKLNGPKGVGLLYKKRSLKLEPYLHGGSQENGYRAGTENILGIAGFAKAVSILTSDIKKEERRKYLEFKYKIVNNLKKFNIPFEVNGLLNNNSLPHILNLWIKGMPTEIIQTNLDINGIAISGGSACTAGNINPSHVLVSMFGSSNNRIKESIRISFGKYNTDSDIEMFNNLLVKIILK